MSKRSFKYLKEKVYLFFIFTYVLFQVGHISVENDFYSRRLMFKQKYNDSYRKIKKLL